jgi:DNA polymerase III delta prime subunit
MDIHSSTFISKYKPYFIDNFCIDDKLKSVLKTLISVDDLNILFIGNPSSGKTTLLSAIIREYYGLSKTQPISETNVLMINNLKEQGISYYRNEMKTFCQSHSSIYGKKKMVVIDDIDNINEQSQQVFRNYIDKYKHNVFFLSVCTNIQKVIESIQSRVHIIRMPIPSMDQIEEIMNYIIEKEDLKIDAPSKEYILSFSKNSVRNVINQLEKIHILAEPVTMELCKNLCSNISFLQFEKYVALVKRGDLVNGIRLIYDIYDYGYSVIDILDYFFTFVKSTDALTEEEKYKIIPFLCKYITIFHNIHEDNIELAILTKDLILLMSSKSKKDRLRNI